MLDSNVLIYAVRPDYPHLLDFIGANPVSVSVISKVEVLGYHGLCEEERQWCEGLFESFEVLPVNEAIIQRAIQLRQMRRMALGDSLIAATALCHELALATRNVDDFAWVPGLELINPVDR